MAPAGRPLRSLKCETHLHCCGPPWRSARRRSSGPKAAPPAGSKPLTEILRPLEAGSDFAYFEEIELEGGKYKIEYFKKDGSKQKIEVDPLTGAASEPAAGR